MLRHQPVPAPVLLRAPGRAHRDRAQINGQILGRQRRHDRHTATSRTEWPAPTSAHDARQADKKLALHYGFSAEQIREGDFNPRMFNSFLDGTKSAIEMAAVANATGLAPPPDGLEFPPAGVDNLANVCRPQQNGGVLHGTGVVEVVSCLNRDGRPVPRDIRMGVYVTIEAASDYVRKCFAEYGLATDDSGAYAAMYKPFHLIALELGISVASVALREEPTGRPIDWQGDVVAVAKRDLVTGESLDGEGGYMVWGKLIPADTSLNEDALPIGLAEGARLVAPVPRGTVVRWQDVSLDDESEALVLRRAMESEHRQHVA